MSEHQGFLYSAKIGQGYQEWLAYDRKPLSAAKIGCVRREALFGCETLQVTMAPQDGRTREMHGTAHFGGSRMYPHHTQQPSAGVIAFAASATSHLRIDEDRPL